jgi:hypothetical protein
METEKKQALLHGEPEQPPPQEHAKVRRRKWCTPTRFGCAASVLALGAVALPLRHSDDLLNCDRQCRWYLGFFERDIHGARNGSDHCSCVRVDATTWQRAPLGQVPYHTTAYAFEGPPMVPPTPFSRADCCVEGAHTPLTNCTPTGRCHGNVYPYAKPFDATAWADKYETPWVCVLGAGEAVPSSVQQPPAVHAACAADGDADAHAHATCQGWKASVEAHGARILHCGVCSSCSSPHDLHVLNATKARAVPPERGTAASRNVQRQSAPQKSSDGSLTPDGRVCSVRSLAPLAPGRHHHSHDRVLDKVRRLTARALRPSEPRRPQDLPH